MTRKICKICGYYVTELEQLDECPNCKSREFVQAVDGNNRLKHYRYIKKRFD